MDHLTLKSTVKKAELQSYLSNMHAMYENLNAEPPRATQIKTIEQGGEEFCIVTSQALVEQTSKAMH